jgi:hypothetical protein
LKIVYLYQIYHSKQEKLPNLPLETGKAKKRITVFNHGQFCDSLSECRCDERLKSKVEESTCLAYTGLIGELEHLKIETRLIDEMFGSVMDEYVFLK